MNGYSPERVAIRIGKGSQAFTQNGTLLVPGNFTVSGGEPRLVRVLTSSLLDCRAIKSLWVVILSDGSISIAVLTVGEVKRWGGGEHILAAQGRHFLSASATLLRLTSCLVIHLIASLSSRS